MSHALNRWYGQNSGTSLVSQGGMSSGRPKDIAGTGGLERTVGQAWSVRVGCPVDVHGTRELDRTVGQAWSVTVGCPADIPWTSTGQVGQSGIIEV